MSSNGGAKVRWSRDGKELFYVEGETLITVEVSTESAFSIGKSTRLFDHPGLRPGGNYAPYDVSPDGKRFILVEPITATGEVPKPTIRIVQNWYEQFRERPRLPGRPGRPGERTRSAGLEETCGFSLRPLSSNRRHALSNEGNSTRKPAPQSPRPFTLYKSSCSSARGICLNSSRWPGCPPSMSLNVATGMLCTLAQLRDPPGFPRRCSGALQHNE